MKKIFILSFVVFFSILFTKYANAEVKMEHYYTCDSIKYPKYNFGFLLNKDKSAMVYKINQKKILHYKIQYLDHTTFINLKLKEFIGKNINLIEQAITHKSYNPFENYEQLEFLGDRVLGLTISNKLIQLYPQEKVGILDKKLASLVNKNKCLEVGNKLNLKKYIFVGNKSSSKSKIENKIISDCCEAIICAIYLDKGLN